MTISTRYGWIYQPKGRAREYAPWALNYYRGCDHGCAYCYGPSVLRMDRAEFHTTAAPRRDALRQIERSAKAASGHVERVLLSFTHDPYQNLDEQTGLTRKVIEILHRHDIHVTILTKGDARSIRDFDLLGPGDAYATTLVVEQDGLVDWEPHAAPIAERIAALKQARDRGLEKVWVSFEPVIWPQESYLLFHRASPYITHCKVGPLNYRGRLPVDLRPYAPKPAEIDWADVADWFQRLCAAAGVKCYLKQDLLDRAGKSALAMLEALPL